MDVCVFLFVFHFARCLLFGGWVVVTGNCCMKDSVLMGCGFSSQVVNASFQRQYATCKTNFFMLFFNFQSLEYL